MKWNFTIFYDIHRIGGDPVNEKVVKIVNSKTYQILFDSSSSSYDSLEQRSKLWSEFEKRY